MCLCLSSTLTTNFIDFFFLEFHSVSIAFIDIRVVINFRFNISVDNKLAVCCICYVCVSVCVCVYCIYRNSQQWFS